MSINLPNQITLSRLLLAILFFALISQYNARDPQPTLMWVSGMIFIIAALTDWLDGYLARRRNQVTSVGRVLDPFVDKILACGTFTLFVGSNFVNASGHNVTSVAPWMAVVMFGREVLVTDVRALAESSGHTFAADIFGKIKTWVQLIAAGYILLMVASGERIAEHGTWNTIKIALIWLAVGSTLASGVNYFLKATPLLQEDDKTT